MDARETVRILPPMTLSPREIVALCPFEATAAEPPATPLCDLDQLPDYRFNRYLLVADYHPHTEGDQAALEQALVDFNGWRRAVESHSHRLSHLAQATLTQTGKTDTRVSLAVLETSQPGKPRLLMPVPIAAFHQAGQVNFSWKPAQPGASDTPRDLAYWQSPAGVAEYLDQAYALYVGDARLVLDASASGDVRVSLALLPSNSTPTASPRVQLTQLETTEAFLARQGTLRLISNEGTDYEAALREPDRYGIPQAEVAWTYYQRLRREQKGPDALRWFQDRSKGASAAYPYLIDQTAWDLDRDFPTLTPEDARLYKLSVVANMPPPPPEPNNPAPANSGPSLSAVPGEPWSMGSTNATGLDPEAVVNYAYTMIGQQTLGLDHGGGIYDGLGTMWINGTRCFVLYDNPLTNAPPQPMDALLQQIPNSEGLSRDQQLALFGPYGRDNLVPLPNGRVALAKALFTPGDPTAQHLANQLDGLQTWGGLGGADAEDLSSRYLTYAMGPDGYAETPLFTPQDIGAVDAVFEGISESLDRGFMHRFKWTAGGYLGAAALISFGVMVHGYVWAAATAVASYGLAVLGAATGITIGAAAIPFVAAGLVVLAAGGVIYALSSYEEVTHE